MNANNTKKNGKPPAMPEPRKPKEPAKKRRPVKDCFRLSQPAKRPRHQPPDLEEHTRNGGQAISKTRGAGAQAKNVVDLDNRSSQQQALGNTRGATKKRPTPITIVR